MNDQSKARFTNVAPVTIAAIVAIFGISALFFMDLGSKHEVPSGAITMITAAVVDQAGATTVPTEPVRP